MIAGWLQPFIALIRPHPPNLTRGETKTKKRLLWEIVHRSVGCFALGLAIMNIFFGFAVAKAYGVTESNKWRTAFIIVTFGILALGIVGNVLTRLGVLKPRGPKKLLEQPRPHDPKGQPYVVEPAKDGVPAS
jgi:cytochrome c biogenesis protein CcdA